MWPFINHKADGYNKTGLFLALVAIYEYSTRQIPKKLASETPVPQRRNSSLLAALPLGSLLFCLHSLLSESSTLVAWSWTGYENRVPRGPVPHLHGCLTVVSMALGLLLAQLSLEKRRLATVTSSPAWFFVGAGSTYVMYSYRNWTGYVGGLGVAVFLMSILPLGFQAASEAAVIKNSNGSTVLNISKIYTMAMGVYCVLNLASIFTVAYAFVPGGVYLRERTDL